MASKKSIFQWQMKELLPDPKKTVLSHLYFNPKVHKDGIPVRPIENTIRTPTASISDFLDRLIRPIFDEKCQATSIINGAQLIEELQKYIKKGLLKSTTLFCTFDIHNLYTMLPQDESLDILIEFLQVHGFNKMENIRLDTIRELASMVLKENVAVYGDHIYKLKIGGAMGSSFTLTLANIFMWKWQKELVRQQDSTNEFYGRYIDDIFMTWNRSERELRKLLDDANQWYPNIKLDYQISQNLPFLDVLLNNQNGTLFTSIYDEPSAERYVVPFISNHPRHILGNIIQGALLTRAVRYSSTFEAFHQERHYLQLMFLYNGYPSSFIEQQFRKFFINYSLVSSFLPYVNDEGHYFLMRNKILGEPTSRHSQVVLNAVTVNTNDDPLNEQLEQSLGETEEAKIKKTEYGQKLILHYSHEKRFESMKQDMHKIYDDIFKNSQVEDIKIIVGSRNRRDARNDLIRKRPKLSILQNKKHKKKRTTQSAHPH